MYCIGEDAMTECQLHAYLAFIHVSILQITDFVTAS